VIVTTASEAGTTSTTTGGRAQTVIPTVYRCGQAQAGDTSVTINGLKDGYYYDVALAATDAVGNVGPLSATCGEPLREDDFFNYYWSENGRAGGGYCSTDGAGAPGGTSAFGVLFAAACAAAVRRKRRRA
jgi:MYXO-CTERM domain-containing protein